MNMTRVIAVFLAFAAAIFGGAYAEAFQERIVSPSEFYYYDANGLRVPLTLTRSIVVRFRENKSADGKQKHLAQYVPANIRDISRAYPRAEFVLDYQPYRSVEDIINILKKMSADPEIDVAPVFLVDGIAAIVDGVYVETAIPLAADTVKQTAEARFGMGLVHEVTPQGSVWRLSLTRLFFLDGGTVPLHALSFANLLHAGTVPNVKRAYPKLAFLHAPIVASLTVTPTSGTVGQKRTIVLRLRVFGATKEDVVLKESDIPSLHEGKFTPNIGGKPPHPWFFDVLSKGIREPVQVGPNEWLIEHRYTFGLYAPEIEWLIDGVKIPHTYRGEEQMVDVPAVTFLVRPHLDGKFEIKDMPYPPQIVMPPFPDFAQKEPVAARQWFDVFAWIFGGRDGFAVALWLLVAAGVLAGSAGVLSAIMRIPPRAPRFNGVTVVEIRSLCERAARADDHKDALRLYHEAISRIFHARHAAFAGRNLPYQDVKERLTNMGEDTLLAQLREEGIEEVFNMLESRHARDTDERTDEELTKERIHLELFVARCRTMLVPDMR